MSKLTGVFELFRFLDQIPTSDINRWLKSELETHQLENFIGNRILYPQTLPITKQEMEIDLAIFREALRRQPEILFDKNGKKIVIPEEVENRFGSIETLLRSCIEAVSPGETRFVYTKKLTGNKLIGSIVSPQNFSNELIVTVTINDQVLGLRGGQIILLPFRDTHLLIKIGNWEVFASGGDLGLMVDLRGRENAA